ncbi:MAG TPA: MarR family transcriptional regulator, partial [Terricaulis sp.]|nr:MarR family transcriptional regulator [Terricaulis sp.]
MSYILAGMQLSAALARLAALARREDWRAGEAEGLTPTQGDILRALVQPAQGLRVGAIAERLHVTQPTASDALAALERKGLVERRADPADGRAALMRLTRKGRALARRWPASFDSVVQALSPRDRAALMGILVRAIDTLQRQGAISRQRMCLSCRYFAPNAHPGQAR